MGSVSKLPQIAQLEHAHQAAGRRAIGVHNAASQFYDDLTYGNWTKETKLKLRLATSSDGKARMSELWNTLFQSQPSESTRVDRLQQWMQDNRDLIGWMSSSAKTMLATQASGAKANAIDDAIAKGHQAVEAAFGDAAKTPEATKALEELASEANTDGAVQAGFHNRLNQAVGRLTKLLVPGAQKSIEELSRSLCDPNATNTERAQHLAEWTQAHPRLYNALDGSIMFSIHHDLSVADFSDQRYAAARNAVLDALGVKETT